MFFKDSSAVDALPLQLQDLIGKYLECELLLGLPINYSFYLTNKFSFYKQGMNTLVA